MKYRVSYNPMNGRLTAGVRTCSYEVAKPQEDSNHWSSTENNRTNAWNVNFNNGNANNNNKYNSIVVRPVAALVALPPDDFTASVWTAYHDCIHKKMRAPQALEYMSKAKDDIPRLSEELWNCNYTPGTSTCFLVRYPKWREVFAADFRDRIVHHWICLRLEPLFEEKFVRQGNVSFNCRKGFGVEKAVEYVAEGMRRVSDNYRRQAWVFRGDLVGFFMSIDKDVMWRLMEKLIRRKYKGDYKKQLISATYHTIMHNPDSDCILNSPASWWEEHLPRNKSLFTTDGKGMPIGNLTTQLFANFLMSHFVSYVQFLFRRYNYCMAQFVDDFIIICDDREKLIGSIDKIDTFLRDKLHLTLHKDKRYLQPVSHGVLFVGTMIKPGRCYMSERTRARMMERCNGFAKMMEDKELESIDCQRVEQVINSYLGFCRRRRTYNIRKAVFDKMSPQLYENFYIKGHYESLRTRSNFKAITL